MATIWIRGGLLGGETEITTGRWKPMMIELRAREVDGEAHVWTVTVESGDGSASAQGNRDTQDITFTFPAGVSLQRYATKDLTAGEFVRFTVKHEESGKNVLFMGMRIYAEVRPAQFIVKGSGAGGQN